MGANCQETKRSIEPDSEMTQILTQSAKELKNYNNMLKILLLSSWERNPWKEKIILA